MKLFEFRIGGVRRNKSGIHRKILNYAARNAMQHFVYIENLESSHVVYVPYCPLANLTGEKIGGSHV